MILDFLLLLMVFGFQTVLEGFVRWSAGDLFLALGLYLSLEKKGLRRLGVLIFLGLWEGYFRATGLLAGFFSALAVFWLEGLLEKRLDLSSPWFFLGVLLISLEVFWFLLLVLFPYLLEKGPPDRWLEPLISQSLITALEMVLILFWKNRFSLEQMRIGRTVEK